MTKSIYQEEYKEITKKLKKARIETGLTQGEVSKILKKPQSYISKIETGDQRIDIVELKLFAKIYNKTLNYFI